MSSRSGRSMRAFTHVRQAGKSGPPRAEPRQARSRERLDHLLDTAAALFATTGYEATTTNAIAEQAGVSVGSLYRYFPDKQAVLRALEERRVATIRALFDRVMNDDVVYLPLPVLLDRLVDPFLQLHLDTPCYAHLLLASDGSVEVGEATCSAEAEIVDRLANLFRRVFPRLRSERARLVATACKATVKALLAAVARGGSADRPQVVAEMKAMLRAYLETIAREHGR